MKINIISMRRKEVADAICSYFNSRESYNFLGCWYIEYNKEDCIGAIVGFIDEFCKSKNPAVLTLAISNKDVSDLTNAIKSESVELNIINDGELEKIHLTKNGRV